MDYQTHCPHCSHSLIGEVKTPDGEMALRTPDIIALEPVQMIRDKKKEYLLCILINARGRVIAHEIISIGTLTASLAHPREILSPAIAHGAASLSSSIIILQVKLSLLTRICG